MKEVIPVPYQVILRKLCKDSYDGTIEVCRLRFILTNNFRMSRDKINSLLIEMKQNGWITYSSCQKVELTCDMKLL